MVPCQGGHTFPLVAGPRQDLSLVHGLPDCTEETLLRRGRLYTRGPPILLLRVGLAPEPPRSAARDRFLHSARCRFAFCIRWAGGRVRHLLLLRYLFGYWQGRRPGLEDHIVVASREPPF